MPAATRLPTSGVRRSAEVAHAPPKMAVRIWRGDGGAARCRRSMRKGSSTYRPEVMGVVVTAHCRAAHAPGRKGRLAKHMENGQRSAMLIAIRTFRQS